MERGWMRSGGPTLGAQPGESSTFAGSEPRKAPQDAERFETEGLLGCFLSSGDA